MWDTGTLVCVGGQDRQHFVGRRGVIHSSRAPRVLTYDIGLANDAGAADERKVKIHARQLWFTKVCLLQSMLFGH